MIHANTARLYGPAILLAAVCVALAFQPPIPQDHGYHTFADTRTVLGIPNGLNVLSNIPFVLVGILGLVMLARSGWKLNEATSIGIVPLSLLFTGVLLIGPGSAWYHLAPSNETLVWDRLPMTVVFMMFLAIMIGDRLSRRIGRLLWLPLLLIGMFSVLYWYIGETRGVGDLRPYILVQFAPMFLLPLIVVLYRDGEIRSRDFWVILLLYAVAKLVEIADGDILAATGGLLSGHSLKHLFAAAATGWMIRLLPKPAAKRNPFDV